MTPLLDDGEGEVLADLVHGRAERVDRVLLGDGHAGWYLATLTAVPIEEARRIIRHRFVRVEFDLRNCATGNYTFSHEMGHNMGLQHDRIAQPANGVFPHSHGYVDVVNNFRDIMGGSPFFQWVIPNRRQLEQTSQIIKPNDRFCHMRI